MTHPHPSQSDLVSLRVIFAFWGAFWAIWASQPPKRAHLRPHKHSQSGAKGPNIGTPGGRHSPWVVWTRYGALGLAVVACVGAGGLHTRDTPP